MDSIQAWYVLFGVVFTLMAVCSAFWHQLPITSSIVYLFFGLAIGRSGLGLVEVPYLRHPGMIEALSELTVIVSLFAAGLKLRASLRDKLWLPPLTLASLGMVLTIILTASLAHVLLGLPLGAAVLLGAVLAPTDPVLASDVQVTAPGDHDVVRFSLTGEAGMNDGMAFPFVMLGVGLLGLHDLGDWGWRWLAVDVLWAITAGIVIGAVMGRLVGKLILVLRIRHHEVLGLDEFLALGLIALSYGAALYAGAYGFLAVFAAGLALRRIEKRAPEQEQDAVEKRSHETNPHLMQKDELSRSAASLPSIMNKAVLVFTEQFERIAEVLMVMLVGVMIDVNNLSITNVAFAAALLLILRPISVLPFLGGLGIGKAQKALVTWFGIRGIGSLYYLFHGINYGIGAELAATLTDVVLTVVFCSILAHGLTATPLMSAYHGCRRRQSAGS